MSCSQIRPCFCYISSWIPRGGPSNWWTGKKEGRKSVLCNRLLWPDTQGHTVSGSRPSYYSQISTGFYISIPIQSKDLKPQTLDEIVPFLVAAECFGENSYPCVNSVRAVNRRPYLPVSLLFHFQSLPTFLGSGPLSISKPAMTILSSLALTQALLTELSSSPVF